MPLTAEQEELKQLFIDALRKKLRTDVVPQPDFEHMANEFIQTMNDLRVELERSPGSRAYHTVTGETTWSLERMKIIERCSDRLKPLSLFLISAINKPYSASSPQPGSQFLKKKCTLDQRSIEKNLIK